MPRPRPSRPPAGRSSASAPASPTSPPPTTSSRPPSRPARDPRWHRYTPAGGLPELKEAIAAKTLRDSGLAVDGRARSSSPTAASRPSTTRSPPCSTRATRCSSRRRTGPPTPSRSGSRAASPSRSSPTRRPATGPPSSSSRPPAPTRTKVLVFVSPSNPTGAVYSARGGQGHRRVGRRARPVGRHRRDLRAPRLRRRRVLLHAGAGARARRPLRRRQRRRQDLRHDRLARRLDDRARRRRQGRHQPPVARRRRNVANVSQLAALAAVSGDLSAVDEMQRRLRPPPARSWSGMLDEIPGVDVPAPEGAFYVYPSVKGAASGRTLRGTQHRVLGPARRPDPRRGRGRGRPRRGVRHPRLPPPVVRHVDADITEGRRRGSRACSRGGQLTPSLATARGAAFQTAASAWSRSPVKPTPSSGVPDGQHPRQARVVPLPGSIATGRVGRPSRVQNCTLAIG